MMSLIEKLKDPNIVANFQKFFGIQIFKEKDENQHIKSEFREKKKNLQTNCHNNVKTNYIINNYFFYYLFFFGSTLGYEVFYAIFFSFWFWNLDEWVGRKIIIIWGITMYIGQAFKDIIKWNRPKSPPVVILEPKYAIEYGMPSTHAMVGFSLPFSILLITNSRYEYSFWIGLVLASFWCILVCTSRLYLGMHTVLDLIGGFLLSAILLIFFNFLIYKIDDIYLKNFHAPFIVLIFLIILMIYYPKSERWSPSRGDTCIMISFTYGIITGCWMNYHLGGSIYQTNLVPPFPVIFPEVKTLFFFFLRSFIGGITIFSFIKIGKAFFYFIICFILKLNRTESKTKIKPIVELPVKFITYALVGFDVTYFCPVLFSFLKIERIKLFDEI